MEDELIGLLQGFGYPVIRQGSLSADEPYPNNFFTFWSNESYSGSYYDNLIVSTIYNYDVNFYSTSPELAYEIIRSAVKKLNSNDFIVSGEGYDVGSDEPTHIGRGINVLCLRYKKYLTEREEKNETRGI